MKKVYSLIICVLFATTIFSQGTIQGFTVSPANPTTTDFVKIFVDVMFTSGGCAVDNQGHFTNGNFTDASATHCLGMLAFICSNVDTFNLGYLQAGNHSFRFTLDVGYGSAGCTAGIVPDVVDSVNFTVSPALGINSYSLLNSSDISIEPNPVNSTAVIKVNSKIKLNDAEFKVMDITGRVVKTIINIKSNEIIFKREELCDGIYFYQLNENNKFIAAGKLVVE